MTKYFGLMLAPLIVVMSYYLAKHYPKKTRRNLATNILATCTNDDRLLIKLAPAGIS